MPQLSQPSQRLIQKYQNWHRLLQSKGEAPVIHVDEVASKVAVFYEKIRGVIDWREEHLLRRTAIERILKRRLFLRQESRELIISFVFELIRGGYFPNNKIEESKIEWVQRTVDKYVFLIQNSQKPNGEKLKIQLFDWLVSLAACEIEEILDPPRRERALIEYMEEVMQERISAPENLSALDKNTQISIAVQKALFKLDKSIISYHLLKKRYPQWLELPKDGLQDIAKNIYSVWENIEKNLKHPLAEKFYRVCEQQDTTFLIFGDILSENPNEIQEKLGQPEVLEDIIREAYARRLGKLKSRIKRAAIFSTVSILLSKILLALAVEVPFDRYITGQFSYQVLGLNVFIPVFFMFFLVATIQPPKKSNRERVVLGTIKMIFESEKKEVLTIKISRKRGVILNVFLTIFYLATFLVSFGLIWEGLNKLNFGILSKIIFLIFFSLISFAGVKIRERSKELLIEEEGPGFFSFFWDSLSLPFIIVGRWLSNQWMKYNVIVVLMSALVDMPFHLFTEFLEQWRYFLKEKKDEIH